MQYKSFIRIYLVLVCSLSYGQTTQWRLATGTSGLYVGAISFFPGDPDTAYAISNQGVLISSTNGDSWDTLSGSRSIFSSILTALKVDPFDSKKMYASHSSIHPGSNDFSMTTDRGMKWQLINGGGGIGLGAVIEMDPSNHETVYAGVGSGTTSILRTTDGGITWIFRPHPVASAILSMAIDPFDPARIYTAYSTLYGSLDTGNSWSPLPFGFPNGSDVRLLVHPVSRAIYATFWPYLSNPGGVFRSMDEGMTWVEMNNGLGANNRHIYWIAVNPAKPNQMFLCTSTPTSDPQPLFFFSPDTGWSWSPLSDGLPQNGHAEMAVVDTLHNRILVSIFTPQGGPPGIYVLDLPTRVDANLADEFSGINMLQNYPNPFNGSTTIEFKIPHKGFIRIEIYDLVGRLLTTIVRGEFEAGSHRAIWNSDRVSSGTYFCRITSATLTKSIVMTVLK